MVEVYLISESLRTDQIIIAIDVVLPRSCWLSSCKECLNEEVVAQPLIHRRITLACLDFQDEFFICLIFVQFIIA